MTKKTLTPQPVKRQTLAEQMAESIKALILSGELESGAVLPTEPELAEQFGVSRAVVRDATRILMAWGLVEVQHGRGVFVTPAQNAAFGEALLLSLQRQGATAWDVEQVGQLLLPEVVALATENATEAELADIRRGAEQFIAIFSEHTRTWWRNPNVPAAALEEVRQAGQAVWEAIFAATHNRLLQVLAQPLMRLRNLRNWRDEASDTPQIWIDREAETFTALVEALTRRDAAQARTIAATISDLPAAAIQAMRDTPVGEIAQIPVSLQKAK